MTEQSEAPLTIEQHRAHIAKYLADNGLQIVIIAVGIRSGQPSNISDFVGHNHVADCMIVEAGTNGANNSSSG